MVLIRFTTFTISLRVIHFSVSLTLTLFLAFSYKYEVSITSILELHTLSKSITQDVVFLHHLHVLRVLFGISDALDANFQFGFASNRVHIICSSTYAIPLRM